jgi:autotransporter-associated beta strand protein
MKNKTPEPNGSSIVTLRTGVRPLGRFAVLAAALVFLQTQHLPAPSGEWINTKSGNWSDAANWTNGVIADGAGSSVIGQSISASGVTRTITVDTPRTIGSLAMTANGRTYRFDGANTITLQGANPALVRCLSGGNLEINVPLAGNVAVRTPNQTGRTIFNAANTYTGDTQVHRSDGARASLVCGVPDAIPHGPGKGNVVMVIGTGFGGNGERALLDIGDQDITINGLISTNTGGISAGNPVVTSLGTGGVTRTLIVGDGDANGNYAEGTIENGPANLVALTKIGSGTQVLGGQNTFTGPTTVNAGALIINGTHNSPVTVNGGLLGGTGTLYNSVVVNAGGTISGGGSVGVLHLVGGLDLSAGGTNLWELVANSESNPGVDFDQIELAAGSLDLNDSTLVVSLGGSVNPADPFWSSPRSWDVITSASGSGTSNFKTVKVQGSAPAGTFTTTNDGTNVKLLFTPGGAPPQPPPTPVRITAITGAGTPSVTVQYTNTIPGSNYVLQAATNLGAPVWVNIVTNQAVGTTGSAVDNTAGGNAQRYYRVFYRYSP